MASTPRRRGFALAGRSVTIDPRTDAVRPDLADVRLADRVFAPHYAAPLTMRLATSASLRAARSADADALVALPAGEPFDLLDVTGGVAWGIATGLGLVGYLDAAALEPVA